MYKISKKRAQELLNMVSSPLYQQKIQQQDLQLEDLFSEDELKLIKWKDKEEVAKEILSKHYIRYSKQKDNMYLFDKVWRQIETATRNDIHDIIRSEAKKDGMPTSELAIKEIEGEIRYEAKEFSIDEHFNMKSTRYSMYVFENGTLYYDRETGDYSFVDYFDPNDEVREEENPMFSFRFTESTEGVEHVLRVFSEWGVSLKQIVYILSYSLFFEKDFANLIFYLVGEGSNGKSQFMKLLDNLFPKKGITHLNISHLTGDKDGSEALEHSYVNISGELKLNDFDSTFMKAITGGDEITINPKHEKPFSIVPTAKHFASSNSFPMLRETTYGDLRRFLILEFNRTFPRTPEFFATRIAPYIPQLFTLCLNVSKKIRQEGMYIRDDYLMRTKARIQKESDLVYQFILEFDVKYDPFCMNREGGYGIDIRPFYKKFERWAKYNNTHTYRMTKFKQRLLSHLGYKIKGEGRYSLLIEYNEKELSEYTSPDDTWA